MRTICTLMATLAMAAALPSVARAELVSNGGFEDGIFDGWTRVVQPFSGLLAVNGLAHGGTLSARFAGYGADDDRLSQTLATQAGTRYTVSFWLSAESGLPMDNHFAFNWDGGPVELDLRNLADQAFTQYSFTLTASTSATSIVFAGRNPTGSLLLDDVSVTEAVPEPGSAALAALGLLACAALRRRRG